MRLSLLTLALLPAAVAPAMSPKPIQITVENLAPDNGFFLTPLWFGLHDGSFDLFDVGSAVTPGLQELAEDGLTGTIETEFAAPGRRQGVVANADGFPGAPVIDAGETATTLLTVNDGAAYPYFSFASMVIPSNDAFIGNDNPLAYELFDAAGEFNGTVTIDLFGSDIFDAGTEINSTQDAAFSTIGGARGDEGGTAQPHPGLANFEGTGTPAGFNVGVGLAPGATDAVARITITQIPEPTTLAVLATAMAGAGLIRRR